MSFFLGTRVEYFGLLNIDMAGGGLTVTEREDAKVQTACTA